MSEWQPIETVPKDGSLFDAWIKGRRITDCHFERGAVMKKHGYPAVWTVFNPQPTHERLDRDPAEPPANKSNELANFWKTRAENGGKP
jgi:hypothetical protein